MGRVAKGLLFLGMVLLLAIVVTANAAADFRDACVQSDAENDRALRVHDGDKECSWTRAWYFATQSVTTVGYGTGVPLEHREIQSVASFWSVFGALSFGLFVSAAFNLSWVAWQGLTGHE